VARGSVQRRFPQRLRGSALALDYNHGVAETSPFCESGFLRTPVVDVTLPTVWIHEPDPDAPFDGFVFHEIVLLHDFYQQNGGPRLLEPACNQRLEQCLELGHPSRNATLIDQDDFTQLDDGAIGQEPSRRASP
jgi:hypothetical protein